MSDAEVTAQRGDVNRLLGPYRLIELLGEGGMGRVYRAIDSRLHREVALKIVREQSADRARRLRNEARAAAALNHPNIVAVYDVGEADGTDYIVAELVRGEPLSARLHRDRLSVDETLDLAIAIAEGLDAAHGAGIVHRDLKPANILLNEHGVAKIADFGLAHFDSARINLASSTDPVTAEGTVVGTSAYMSPEQARGDAVDFRSDQFSFGSMLFEMLTGRRPFERDTTTRTLAAVIADDVPRRDLERVPRNIRRILLRCLAKKPEGRYANTAGLVRDLIRARNGRTRRITWTIAAAAATIVVAVIVVLMRNAPAVPPASSTATSIAVLPFRNVAGDPSLAHFGLGIADGVTGELAALPNLIVRPTSAVTRFDGNNVDAIGAGRELGVAKVVDGTVERINDAYRITAQLSDVERGAIVWSTRIEVHQGELFKLQDAAAEEISQALRLQVTPHARQNWSHEVRVSDSAMEEYLSMRSQLAEVPRAGVDLSRQLLTRLDALLAREPQFARALGARAFVEANLNFYEPSTEWRERADTDARRALALEGSLVEARLALFSSAYSSSGGWKTYEGLRELEAAVREAPGNDVAHMTLARLYRHLGWLKQVEAERAIIKRINPLAAEIDRTYAFILGDFNRCQEALAAFPKLTSTPGDAYPVWQPYALTRMRCGERHPVREEIEQRYRESNPQSPDYSHTVSLLALARVLDGVRDVSALERDALSVDQRAGHYHHTAYVLAEIAALQGDQQRALRYLRQAAETGMPAIDSFEKDPFLSATRKTAEYQTFIAELRRREPQH